MFRKLKKPKSINVPTKLGIMSKLGQSGRDLWMRQFGEKPVTTLALCQKLVTLHGEASAVIVADEVIARLALMDDDEFIDFLNDLLMALQPEPGALKAMAQNYLDDPNPESVFALTKAVESPRQSLFRMISASPRGPMALLGLRTRLLGVLKAHPEFLPIDGGLLYLFRSWYNRGFLELRRIDWNTPASILEKLIAYEAVHEIQGWSDLRRRLAEDRRCYAFFHPALKDEPLIFVQVALLGDMASHITDIIPQDIEALPVDEDIFAADTAIFYSISNCQPGLRGVSFGNFLIKQVVRRLLASHPSLSTFATLSPVPGFSKWLASQSETTFETDDAQTDRDYSALCAYYLLHAKRGNLPLDPVARFHLGNGARLERINSGGDMSERGLAQSKGILVNYVYNMDQLEQNHENLVNEGIVAAHPNIGALAASAAKLYEAHNLNQSA